MRQHAKAWGSAGLPHIKVTHHGPPLPEPSEDGDGVDDAGLPHIHLLEAALQGRVLLNVLPVLVQGGGADAAQLAAPKHGLQQVACRAARGESDLLQKGLRFCAYWCCHLHFPGSGSANALQLATPQHALQLAVQRAEIRMAGKVHGMPTRKLQQLQVGSSICLQTA